ncbi:MAG: aminodeoxychorismate/anthranilate synthase component II, partial [Pseudomonadota bacterium]
MILLIDNYDSFTYNLYQQLESLGAHTTVVPHDHITLREIKQLKPSGIIISPGPGKPASAGISLPAIKSFYKTTPLLGVCLGHECLGEAFGAQVVHAKKIMHGKTSRVYHAGTGIFKGLKNPFVAARYHSLAINRVPRGFSLSAWDRQREIMAIAHATYPAWGIQFHPESFMTEDRYHARAMRVDMTVDPKKTIVMMTSNRADVQKDLANRAS